MKLVSGPEAARAGSRHRALTAVARRLPEVMKLDLTMLSIPGFVGSRAAGYAWQECHPVEDARAGDYEPADTSASLAMGIGT